MINIDYEKLQGEFDQAFKSKADAIARENLEVRAENEQLKARIKDATRAAIEAVETIGEASADPIRDLDAALTRCADLTGALAVERERSRKALNAGIGWRDSSHRWRAACIFSWLTIGGFFAVLFVLTR